MVGTLDYVCERGRAEFEGDVEEVFAGFLVEVSDDVGVVVGFLEDVHFAEGEGDEVLEETFDGDGAALEGALEDYSPMGAETCTGCKLKISFRTKSNSPKTVSETINEGMTGIEVVGGGTTIADGDTT